MPKQNSQNALVAASLRPARLKDIHAIEAFVRPQLYLFSFPFNKRTQLPDWFTLKYTHQALEDIILNTDIATQVVECQDSAVAFSAFDHLNSTLLHLYVKAGFQKRGFGKTLFEALPKEKPFFLRTPTPSMGFFFKMGCKSESDFEYLDNLRYLWKRYDDKKL